AKCRVHVAANAVAVTHNMVKKLNDIDEGVYDETVRRGTDDIRRVLRTRYTIAE
ncbi:hypothetical protein HDR66_02970, partial [bacterium]|nr:hypothetical protein [bacterium]